MCLNNVVLAVETPGVCCIAATGYDAIACLLELA
jgi:hypothetical protein